MSSQSQTPDPLTLAPLSPDLHPLRLCCDWDITGKDLSKAIEHMTRQPGWRPGRSVTIDLQHCTCLGDVDELFSLAFDWGSLDRKIGAGVWRLRVATRRQAAWARRLIALLQRGVQARLYVSPVQLANRRPVNGYRVDPNATTRRMKPVAA